MSHVREFKPDLHILFKGELFNAEIIEEIRSCRIPTVLWHHDAPAQPPPWLIKMAGASDWFFTHARGMVERFREVGLTRTDWLSEGFPERFFSYDGITDAERRRYACEVTLVGNIHRNPSYRLRADMLDRAIRAGFHVKWWGPHISRRLANIPLLISRAARSYGGCVLANADFAKAANCSTVFLARDMDPNMDGSVSNRLYWACGSGAFYLTFRTRGIEDIMQPGKEIETFDDLDEMVEKIRWYTDHPDERRRIAEAGKQRVLKNYTFRHRFEEMFRHLDEKGII